MKTLWKENRILCVISLISIIIVLAYNISYNMPELISGIGLWYTLLYDLSIGVLINFMFFIFQVIIPSYKKQQTAFSIAKSKLERLYFLLSDITLSTDKYIKINSDDSIEVPNVIHYFLRHDAGSNCGWLIRMDFSTSGIERYTHEVTETLNEITSNFTYSSNNYELIEKLSKLQSNNYLNYLTYAIQNPNSNTKFGHLQHEYTDFKNITLYLGLLVNKSYPDISSISETQKQNWEREYDNFSEDQKSKIPRHWIKLD